MEPNHTHRKLSRVLNRDGSFNAVRLGIQKRLWNDIYHSLLTIAWPKFLALVLVSYVLINLCFASAYLLCGESALLGTKASDPFSHFLEAFFFSVQTFATIGYGGISPNSLPANLIVTLEALFGLLGLALATGLLFARFSRPTARVIFSNRALITNHRGKKAFLFRIANQRLNQIVEAQMHVVYIRSEVSSDGSALRNIIDLPLVRSRSPIFAHTWTAVHLIDEKSPLNEITREAMTREKGEILASMTGIDDTFSSTIHTRYSYTPEEIEWKKQFEDILSWNEAGLLQIDLTKIHNLRDI